MTEQLLYTKEEVRKALRIGNTTLYWLIRAGQLKTIHIGGKRLFPTDDVFRLAREGTPTLSDQEKKRVPRLVDVAKKFG